MVSATQRCGILIPVRLASERLPGKALRDLCGRPALYHLLDRCAACRYVSLEDIVVCTTLEPSDDPLVTAVEAYGAAVYRGPTDDLIRRLSEAVESHRFDVVVEADGDDLCCATEYMDLCFAAMIEDPATEIVTCEGLPLGIAPRGFRRSAMRRVMETYATEQNDTAFFHLFIHTGYFRQTQIEPVDDGHRHADARLTLDYEEDLEFFRGLFDGLAASAGPASLRDCVAWLRANPEHVSVNRDMTAAYKQRQEQKAHLQYRAPDGALRDIAL